MPHPQECGCQQCFRHDVHQCDCSTGRLRRGEPPPSRKVFSRLNVLSGTACATVLRHAVLSRLAPRFTSTVPSVKRGAPAASLESTPSFPFLQGQQAHGRRRFAPPSPPQSCASVPPQPWHQFSCPPCTLQAASAMHAVGHRAVLLLVHRVQLFGVLGRGLFRNRSGQW
jgi:hypothetical protein